MDGTGQRLISASVDMVFFAVIGLLGYAGKLSEPTLAVLFTAYASQRFGVAMGKQQAAQRAFYDNNGNSGPPTSGTSGSMRATIEVGDQKPATRRYGNPIPRTDETRRVSFASEPESPILVIGNLIRNQLKGFRHV